MAVSDVAICNMALGRAGSAPIAALTEDSESAVACGIFYDRARRATIRAHPWTFATASAVLARSTNTPVGWDYEFALPAGCLRPLYLHPHSSQLRFEVRGRALLTNEETASLIYLKDVTDPNQFDESFIDALAFRLAADVVMYVSGNQGLQAQLMQQALFVAAAAQANDANVGNSPRNEATALLDARN